MYYITKPSTKTGKKALKLYKKVIHCTTERDKLLDELNVEQFYRSDSYAYGGMNGIMASENPDPKIWKPMKNAENGYKPNNTKKGKELQEKMHQLPTIGRAEVNAVIGLTQIGKYAGFTVKINKDTKEPVLFGFRIREEWGFTMPTDCEEITTMKYNSLFI